MTGLQDALARLRARADGHNGPFTVLDASYVWAELVRLRALAADRPEARAARDGGGGARTAWPVFALVEQGEEPQR